MGWVPEIDQAVQSQDLLEVCIGKPFAQVSVVLVKQVRICACLSAPSTNIMSPKQNNKLLCRQSQPVENFLELCHSGCSACVGMLHW